jgi:hypothetical protein
MTRSLAPDSPRRAHARRFGAACEPDRLCRNAACGPRSVSPLALVRMAVGLLLLTALR